MSDKDVIERNRIIAEKSAEIERLRRELAEAIEWRDAAQAELGKCQQDALRLQDELAEARGLLRDVIGRWQGRIDYYGHAVLDSDVARRIDAALAGEKP